MYVHLKYMYCHVMNYNYMYVHLKHNGMSVISLPSLCVHRCQAADLGAESTRDLTARAGRASYIAAERVILPDPGAVAIAAILRAVLESLEGTVVA